MNKVTKINLTAVDRVALKEQLKGSHQEDAKYNQFLTYYEQPTPMQC